MNTSVNPNLKGINKLTPKELVFKYLTYLPLFIISILLALGITWFKIRYENPVYTSIISIIIKTDDRGRGSSGGEVKLEDLGFIDKKVNLANEIELMKSAYVMERVVNAIGANVQYYNEGNIRKSEIYQANSPFKLKVLEIHDSSAAVNYTILKQNNQFQITTDGEHFKKLSDGDILKHKAGIFKIIFDAYLRANKNYKYFISVRPAKAVATQLASSLEIKQLSRETSILKASLNSEVPERNEDILDQFVVEYNKVSLEDKNKMLENTISFIDERLKVLSVELGKVEQGLSSFRQRNDILSVEEKETSEYADLKVKEAKLGETEMKMQILRMVNDYVGNERKRYSLVPSSLGIDDITLNKLIADYNQLQIQRSEQLKTVPEANPGIQTLNFQLEDIRQRIREDLSNLTITTGRILADYKQDYYTVKSRLHRIPEQQRELLDIMRQQGIKEKLFVYLLQKREESSISRASTVGGIKSLDKAKTSRSPISPDKSSMYRLALIIGIGLPFAFVYLRDILNDKINTKRDLAATNVPIIGEISHYDKKQRQIVTDKQDRSVLAEQFRLVRTNLQLLHKKTEHPVIMLTSTVGGEGKTFCAINLSAILALTGKKTVIIELDLRKPKVSKALGLTNHKGISHYIAGSVSMEELPVKYGMVDNLYVVPCGPIPPNPSEILLDEKMEMLFSYLKAEFDYVIVDTAPIGLVSDAKVLARYADSTLYIIRHRYTVKKQLEFIDGLYIDQTFPNMSLLINDVHTKGFDSYYGYGYGYGYSTNSKYGYNYNYGYSNNKSKTPLLDKVKNFLNF